VPAGLSALGLLLAMSTPTSITSDLHAGSSAGAMANVVVAVSRTSAS
jgi:hypothetical protein